MPKTNSYYLVETYSILKPLPALVRVAQQVYTVETSDKNYRDLTSDKSFIHQLYILCRLMFKPYLNNFEKLKLRQSLL